MLLYHKTVRRKRGVVPRGTIYFWLGAPVLRLCRFTPRRLFCRFLLRTPLAISRCAGPCRFTLCRLLCCFPLCRPFCRFRCAGSFAVSRCAGPFAVFIFRLPFPRSPPFYPFFPAVPHSGFCMRRGGQPLTCGLRLRFLSCRAGPVSRLRRRAGAIFLRSGCCRSAAGFFDLYLPPGAASYTTALSPASRRCRFFSAACFASRRACPAASFLGRPCSRLRRGGLRASADSPQPPCTGPHCRICPCPRLCPCVPRAPCSQARIVPRGTMQKSRAPLRGPAPVSAGSPSCPILFPPMRRTGFYCVAGRGYIGTACAAYVTLFFFAHPPRSPGFWEF